MLCLCRPPIVSKMRSKSVISNKISRLENGIIVVDDVFWCSVIWSRNAELLREPELIWRISDRYMNDSLCPMNDDQNIQNSKRKSRYREEGNAPHFLSMILRMYTMLAAFHVMKAVF